VSLPVWCYSCMVPTYMYYAAAIVVIVVVVVYVIYWHAV
jgi:hypothetical protein